MYFLRVMKIHFYNYKGEFLFMPAGYVWERIKSLTYHKKEENQTTAKVYSEIDKNAVERMKLIKEQKVLISNALCVCFISLTRNGQMCLHLLKT